VFWDNVLGQTCHRRMYFETAGFIVVVDTPVRPHDMGVSRCSITAVMASSTAVLTVGSRMGARLADRHDLAWQRPFRAERRPCVHQLAALVE
jgi:hypothetical protein